MPNIVFIEPDGTRRDIAAEVGESAMEAARRNAVDNILAECGGSCICATCHVYVEDTWISKVGPVGNDEGLLLDMTAAVRRPNSRLCCQIRVTPALDGLTLRLPDKQV